MANYLEYSNEHFQQITTFSPNTVHDCKKCNYKATTFFSIYNHIQRHKIKPPTAFDCTKTLEEYLCKNCTYKTHQMVHFRNHIRTHKLGKLNQKYFFCDKCIYKSRSFHGLARHKSIVHSSELEEFNWFNCDQCEYRAKTKHNLKSHQNRVHSTSVVRFKCDQCLLDFKHIDYLKRHKAVVHDKKKCYKCENCPFSSFKEDSLYNHDCNKTRKTKQIVSCYHCGFSCVNKVRLISHLRIHNYNVTFLHCEDCEFKTKYSKSMKNHRLFKHANTDNVDWLCCELCSYKGKTKGNLKQHYIGVHTPSEHLEWFYCANCPYKAKFKNRLIAHMGSHISYKKFQCSLCAYKTNSTSGFKRHQQRRNHLNDSFEEKS